MSNIKMDRKYFSYAEIVENPASPFINSSKDSQDILVKNNEILEVTLSDFFALMKQIKKEREDVIPN